MAVGPEMRYTKSGDLDIAYLVTGEGPIDVVYIPTWISAAEHLWEYPPVARFLNRMSSFSRLIMFDRRGTGMSDRRAHAPTLEEQMDDVLAVLDAVGSERAAILAETEGTAPACLFAATHPDRTAALPSASN